MMKIKKVIYSLLGLLLFFSNANAQVFSRLDSIRFNKAQIWGVLSDDGDSLCVTTIFTPATKPHIYLRKVNYGNIAQQSTPKQLTFDADFSNISNLTDHKHIILNNEIYVAFSTQGDHDLFLFKTDINGNRIGSIVPVIQGSTDPTNDMMLTTDGISIFVLHFDPPNQSHVYTFDTNLNAVGSAFSTTTLAHNNIGNVMYYGDAFWMFTGNVFGLNSNLTLTKWTNTFSPKMATPKTVLNSTAGDGNWFSTGVICDSINQRWYIGMNHLETPNNVGQEHVDLLAFDNNFNVLERKHITAKNYTRPHFVLKNNFLYVSYDSPGKGVYLLKYQISFNTAINEACQASKFLMVPNPSTGTFEIKTGGDEPSQNKKYKVEIFNLLGERVYADLMSSSAKKIDLSNHQKGIYFVRISSEGKCISMDKLLIDNVD